MQFPQTQRPPNRREMFKWCRALASAETAAQCGPDRRGCEWTRSAFQPPAWRVTPQVLICVIPPSFHTSVVRYSSTTCCNSTLWTIQMIYSKCNTADSQHSDLSFQLNAGGFPKQTHERGKTFFFLYCSANTLRQMSAGVAAWAEWVIPVSVSSSHFLTRS